MKNKKQYILIAGIAGIVLLSAVIWFAKKDGQAAAPNGNMENMFTQQVLDDDVIPNDATTFE